MSMCIVHVHYQIPQENVTLPITNHALVISLPLNLLYTVRLAPKQKVGLATVFTIGIIIILVAIARAVQISRKAFADGVLLALWGIIESTVCEYRRLLKPVAFGSTLCWVMMCLKLICDPSSASAVIVGCLPPFKSLFRDRRSFQRYNSPVNGKDLLPGLRLDVIRSGNAETGNKAKAAPKVKSRPIDGEPHVFNDGYGGGFGVPPGAIGVRSDYVSCNLGAWKNI